MWWGTRVSSQCRAPHNVREKFHAKTPPIRREGEGLVTQAPILGPASEVESNCTVAFLGKIQQQKTLAFQCESSTFTKLLPGMCCAHSGPFLNSSSPCTYTALSSTHYETNSCFRPIYDLPLAVGGLSVVWIGDSPKRT